jgi:hypothetical protein
MPSGIKYEALKAANVSSTDMTRLIHAAAKLARRSYHNAQAGHCLAIERLRLQCRGDEGNAVSTRFEVGEQGERLFQKVSQTSPKIVISSVSTSTRWTSNLQFLAKGANFDGCPVKEDCAVALEPLAQATKLLESVPKLLTISLERSGWRLSFHRVRGKNATGGK